MEDERAYKIGFDIKGASGCKCCLSCRAICGATLHPPEGGYFVRFDEPDRSKWDPHTVESIKECINAVDAAKDAGPALKEVETNSGINYNPYGAFWDPYLVDLMRPPHFHFWDAMHCLYASGGVAQYQMNAYIYSLTQMGITVDDLDRFTNSTKGHRLQSKTFFKDRFVKSKNAHMRVFASECVDVVLVLSLHADLVVARTGSLPEEVECLQCLACIAKILGKPNDIMQNLTALEETLHRHHVLYNRCGYKRIPIHNYLRHLTDCIAMFEALLTAWAPERDHHYSKGIAQHCFDGCEKTILERSNYKFFSDLADKPTMLEETYLQNPTPCSTFDDMLGGADVTASRDAITHIGELKRGTYVWIADATCVPVLCTVETFLHVRMDCRDSVQVMCSPMAYLSENTWSVQDTVRHVIEPVSHVMRRAIVYVDPSMPRVLHARP